MVWHRQIMMLLGLVLSGVLVSGCSSPSRQTPVEAAAAAGGATAQGAPLEDISSYRLGPGDALRVNVFRHEDLSGEFTLDGDGYFALPLVGEVLGGGRSARELENEIETALKSGGYLVDPQVSIQVLNYRPFYIIGEVNNPGSFEYVNGMTVINAVALAGGFTYRADQDDIVISRGGSSGPEIEAAPDTEVLPGDIIEVQERFF
jgi:protein involved in polysaccharide export with SLBB domain